MIWLRACWHSSLRFVEHRCVVLVLPIIRAELYSYRGAKTGVEFTASKYRFRR